MNNYRTLLLILICCLLFSTPSLSKKHDIDILVEDGYFPIIVDAEDRQGFAFEFIHILNDSQQAFNFVLHVLPSKRLIKRVEEQKFDALFFMAIEWLPKSSHSYLTKTDSTLIVKNEFYTLKDSSLDQSYFDNLDVLTKAGVYGYSYKFAGFNTDATFLNNVHRMSLTKSGYHVAKMILLKRVDIGIINNLTYQYFLKNNSFDMDLFYKSTTPDGVYGTSFLINQNSTRISASKFDLITQLPTVKDKLQKLFIKYGMQYNIK
jgi:hypothetical protein